LIIIVLPAIGMLGSGAAMLAYPLRRGVHGSIVAELARRTAGHLEPSELGAEA
jgi:Na+/melibiose symporter-like transporter